MNLCSFVLAIELAICPLGVFSQAELIKSAIKRGEKHLASGEFRLASQELKKAYRLQPLHPKLNALLGSALFQLHEKQAAEPYLKKAINAGLETPDILVFYAQCLHVRLELDSARSFYEAALKAIPKLHPDRKELVRRLEQIEHARELIQYPVRIQIENVGPAVNSPFPEYTPIITADESALYFTSRRFSNLGKERQDDLPYEDLYISRRKWDGTWSQAQNVGPPINTIYHDATVCLSADGQTLWFYRAEGLYFAEFKGRKLVSYRMVGPPIESNAHEPSASLSADGRILYFSREAGSNGDYDLFESTLLTNGKWSEPRRLPESINTPYDENSPFIHPDGKTLYFASKGHNSMGGYDLFRSTRQMDGSWSKPQNLGWPLNSADDDVYLVVSASGRYAYFSSTRPGGLGSHDIYRIDFAPDAGKQDASSFQADVLLVKGQLLDAATDLPIGAKLYILDLEKNDTLTVTYADGQTGEYLFALPTGSLYAVYIEQNKYQTETRSFDTRTQSGYDEVRQNIKLKFARLQVGERLLLRNLFFDFNQATLRPESKAELERLYELLKRNPSMRIRIRGHTDNVGSDDYNLTLSAERAQAVVDYLVKRGIAAGRLESQGLGETEPIDSNDSDVGRQNNRRTEFEVLQL
jgi:outer membrane protein OmpA-like peptidoglycan-associated protein/tetratricopeptide (TPR) repeat protein